MGAFAEIVEIVEFCRAHEPQILEVAHVLRENKPLLEQIGSLLKDAMAKAKKHESFLPDLVSAIQGTIHAYEAIEAGMASETLTAPTPPAGTMPSS